MKAARIMRIWKGPIMATIQTPGSVLYRSSCTIILNSESMIDSKGKIMAESTTKYMMLRPVQPRRESM